MRILIADDDVSIRRILRVYLSRWGHEIVECSNGSDALAVFQNPNPPAVAILDWEMPGLDGPTVCRRLREIDRHIYVILLTVRAATEDVVEAIGAGADEHLSKTTAPAELQARLRAALRVADMRHQLAQSEAALQQAVERLAQRGQAQRLESIGALAAGIAHEINTPMQYIGDNVGFLRDSWPVLREAMTYAAASGAMPGDLPYLLAEIPIAIDQTLEGVARVSVIVGAMKEFAHPGTGECAPIDINHTIVTAINVARHEWKYVCEIETELSPELPPVSSRPGELNQVILNLLVNAAQAIADAGPHDRADARIAIRTRHVDDAVEISVADTGPGIPEAIRGRIFDPFFTTKEVGRGTGQGLAIVHDIVVHKHHGRLWFDTQVGTGTTFHVRLPLQAMSCADGHLEADPVRR